MADFVRASVSVGREHWVQVMRHGPHSRFEVVYRAAMVLANVQRQETSGRRSRLTRTQAYVNLDPSEKGAVSYFIAQALAKRAAEVLLGVPWLLHLAPAARHFSPTLNRRSLKCPDLLGIQHDTGNAIAIEAKGRTHGIPSAVLLGAKDQLENLIGVRSAGSPTKTALIRPSMRVAVATGFTRDGIMTMQWEDPPDDAHERDATEQECAAVLDAYYRPLVDVIISTEGEQGQFGNYRTRYLPEVDLTLGVDADLIESEGISRLTAARKLAGRMLERGGSGVFADDFTSRRTTESAPGERSFGLDGVFVELGPLWDEVRPAGGVRRGPPVGHRRRKQLDDFGPLEHELALHRSLAPPE